MYDEQHSHVRIAHDGARLHALQDAKPLRLLIEGALPFENLGDERIEVVASSEDVFDVMCFCGPYDEERFRQFLSRASNPAAPLIVQDPAFGARADVRLTHTGPGDVVHAAAELAGLAERVQRLPQIPRGAERPGLLALVLAATRQTSIDAGWQPDRRALVGYDWLLGVEQPRSVLEQLANIGFLKRRYFEKLHVCGACQGARVFAREVCGRCTSSDLAEHQLLHHYTCGLQAPEPVFQRGDGYECPKCRKPFRHYGVDYDKPGQVISCSSCDATVSEPDVFFVCADCGEQTDSEQARAERWYHYHLTAQGLSAAETGVLPLLDGVGTARRDSLQEFRVMVQNYVHVAERVERPLTMVRFDLRAGNGQSLERGLAQLFTLVQETARKGDAVTLADGCVLACLPETDAHQVQPLLDRVEGLVGAQLAAGYDVHPHVIPRDRVLAMLRALDG